MFYWLFTEGKSILAAFVLPLSCGFFVLPLTLAAILGAGIQRRSDGTQLQTTGWLTLLRWLTLLVANFAVVAVFTNLVGGIAIARSAQQTAPLKGPLALLVGGPNTINQPRLLILGFAVCCIMAIVNIALWQGIRNGGWLREQLDRLRRPDTKRGEMGSAHFCTRREYTRFRRVDPDGVTFLGAFWGEKHYRLDYGWGRFCLSGEDAARGILTLGAPGSGKSAGVILPVIADRMLAGHSLIVADPQGELVKEILKYAKCTRHMVVIHDPTSLDGPRYNLAAGLTSLPTAAAIAKVLIPAADGDNKFWSDSAADLLSACLVRFDNLGQIKGALDDLQALAKKLAGPKDDATLAASAFIASVGSDGKVASNIVATLGTALSGWASAPVRANTSTSDFDAELLVMQPTVVVLSCPEEMRKVYGPYLGATLEKLMGDLNTIAKRNEGGKLPVPVGIILDEFPALGKLDNLVGAVNMIRKRRISVLIAAQTKGQFHLIYGEEGTKALFTGLATQIIYGGGDHDTAKFYSDASGTATVDANPDPAKANLRGRQLLTTDEIVSPDDGVCHIFSRFVNRNFAAQVIIKARLTMIFERTDWTERLAHPAYSRALQLERGISLNLSDEALPTSAPASPAVPPIQATPASSGKPGDLLDPTPTTSDEAAVERMRAIRDQANKPDMFAEAGIKTTSIEEARSRFGIGAGSKKAKSLHQQTENADDDPLAEVKTMPIEEISKHFGVKKEPQSVNT